MLQEGGEFCVVVLPSHEDVVDVTFPKEGLNLLGAVSRSCFFEFLFLRNLSH